MDARAGTRHNLLTDPLFSVRLTDGSQVSSSLPVIFSLLSTGNQLDGFVRLQGHHRQPWHAFLCQLAAIALSRRRRADAPQAEETWREFLLALTDQDPRPWCLYVEDPSVPGFFQLPSPSGDLTSYSDPEPHLTRRLGIAVPSQNHSPKLRRGPNPEPEDWAYALAVTQTMTPYGGVMTRGIVRATNRCCAAFAATLDWGPRFQRDLRVLIRQRREVAADSGHALEGGMALMWTEPWPSDPDQERTIDQLHPYFLETPRFYRLVETDRGWLGLRRRSTWDEVLPKPPSTDAGKDMRATFVDPWQPVDRAENQNVRPPTDGWDYRMLQDLMFSGDYDRRLARDVYSDDPDEMVFYAWGIARGQYAGKTTGVYEREIPIPPPARDLLVEASERERLAQRARARVKTASEVRRRVLTPALRDLVARHIRENQTDDRDWQWVNRWRSDYDRAVDDRFFQDLWAALEVSPEEARDAWQDQVLEIAESIYEQAAENPFGGSMRRYRLRAEADNTLARRRAQLRNSG